MGCFPPTISVFLHGNMPEDCVWGNKTPSLFTETLKFQFCCDCCPLQFSLTAFHLHTEHELLSCSYYVTDIHVCTPCYTFIIDQLSLSACSLFESVFMSLHCLVLNFPRCLLAERDAVRPDSPLTHRLMQKALALQD